jgi:hypothetical protein
LKTFKEPELSSHCPVGRGIASNGYQGDRVHLEMPRKFVDRSIKQDWGLFGSKSAVLETLRLDNIAIIYAYKKVFNKTSGKIFVNPDPHVIEPFLECGTLQSVGNRRPLVKGVNHQCQGWQNGHHPLRLPPREHLCLGMKIQCWRIGTYP